MAGYTRTVILLAAMTALFGVIGLAIGGEQGMIMALIFAGGMNLFSWWNSDKMVLRMHNAQPIGPQEAPRLYEMTAQLAANAAASPVDLATAAEKTDLPRALQVYQEAAAIDADYALLNFRIARTLDRLGRPTEALPYFERAKDTDICPLRITAPLEHTLLRIAAETDTPLVDAAQIIAARSPDGIPGNDWYVDHVHPSIGGHQLIARTIAAQFPAGGWLPAAAEWPEAERVKTYARHLATVGPAYLADGKRRLAWLEDWAKRQRLAAETTPHDAAGFARLAFRHLDLGDDAAAQDALREALKRDTGVADLVRARAEAKQDATTAIIRIEQLYPLHADRIREVVARYKSVKRFVWCQEEPENQGAWLFLAPRIAGIVGSLIGYAGRSESASPAVGSYGKHKDQLVNLLKQAFEI